MPTARESRAILQRLTATASESSLVLFDRFNGAPEAVRGALLEAIPAEIAYFANGSAALAADSYAEERSLAKVTTRFTPLPVVLDRTVKVRRAIAWASDPLFLPNPDRDLTRSRIGGIVTSEVIRPNRDTTLENRRRDPSASGWRRITKPGACGFCRMLADRGAVYRQKTAYFAAHDPVCHCVAQPVWSTDDTIEVGAIQYMASKRSRTPEQREKIRAYIASNFS